MVKSTFISIGLHVFFILVAYYGLPSFKVKEPFDQPIDIVEDTPVSSKTSLKLGEQKEKKINKEIEKEEKSKKKTDTPPPIQTKKEEKKKEIALNKVKKTPPPPPPLPSKKIIDKKNIELKKKKNLKEIAELIKKKPKSKIEKNKKVSVPKVKIKPKEIKKKQKKLLAKGILKTLTKPQPIINKDKINKSQNNNKNVFSRFDLNSKLAKKSFGFESSINLVQGIQLMKKKILISSRRKKIFWNCFFRKNIIIQMDLICLHIQKVVMVRSYQ